MSIYDEMSNFPPWDADRIHASADALITEIISRNEMLNSEPYADNLKKIVLTAIVDSRDGHSGDILSDIHDMLSGMADRYDAQAILANGDEAVEIARTHEGNYRALAQTAENIRDEGYTIPVTDSPSPF